MEGKESGWVITYRDRHGKERTTVIAGSVSEEIQILQALDRMYPGCKVLIMTHPNKSPSECWIG